MRLLRGYGWLTLCLGVLVCTGCNDGGSGDDDEASSTPITSPPPEGTATPGNSPTPPVSPTPVMSPTPASPTPMDTPSPIPTATPVPEDLDHDSYSVDQGDCDDHESAIHPGATDVPYDGIDQDCSGTDLTDADGDSYDGTEATGGTDCDDADANTYPGAPEFADDKDNDCDGRIDEDLNTTDDDGDGSSEAMGDCNDGDASIYQGALEIPYDGVDQDCSGADLSDVDQDGYPSTKVAGGTDCNDASASINPAALEACDGIDNNCDGVIDEGVTTTWYADVDKDGYGASASSTKACSQPKGYVASATDCDDSKAAVHPDAKESCNGIDDNCNGAADEGLPTTTWYADADEDGYGNPASSTKACTAPGGYVADGTDCNDGDAAVSPGATERCNGADDNCNDVIDEGLTKSTWYADADKDGYGNPGKPQPACSKPAGYVADKTDCDDTSASINPGATEICNGSDDNCNDVIDEGVKTTYYADDDKDGYGNPSKVGQACSKPAGYVSNASDCDDSSGTVNPGTVETCNSIDDNCNGQVDEGVKSTFYLDADKDGYGSPDKPAQACSKPSGYTLNSTDCNDASAAVYPGAVETCNGTDDNCDGSIDEGLKATTFYQDADKDTYGNPAKTLQACSQPSGYVASNTDCNDAAAAVYPGASEVCNLVDDDCNGIVDDPSKIYYYLSYPDADGDGYGDPKASSYGCYTATGYVTRAGDCNDSDATVTLGTAELCDGLDNDCDGRVDEVASAYFRDQDGDGFGSANDTACTATPGYIQVRGDCNDGNASIHPGAADAASDGIDQDCGGTSSPDPHVGLSGSSFSTLQAALDAAHEGQTVWVGPGTYKEFGLSFSGRGVVLMSTHFAKLTSVDAQQRGAVMNFVSSEDLDTVVDGLTLTGGLGISNNAGGGIFMKSASPTMTGCIITGNTNAGYGGGINLSSANPILTNCTISGNKCTATTSYGGGVFVGNSSPMIDRCTFTGNSAVYGAGMYVSYGNMALSNSTFTGNLGTYGGGLYVIYSNPVITGCTFSSHVMNNGGTGAGMYLSQSNARVSNCVLTGNSTTGSAAGIYSVYGAPTLNNCLFTNNSANYMAGGLWLDVSNARVSNCSFTGNYALYYGAGIYVTSASPTVSNCTLVGNTGYLGVGMYLYQATAGTYTNMIMAYNTGNATTNLVINSSLTPVITYSNLYNPPGTTSTNATLDATNTTLEPGFLSYANGVPSSLHLAKTSKLVNAGSTALYDADGTRSDMGAYGGDNGDGWDLDADGYPDYFWPGTLSDAPAGFSAAAYDGNDLNASNH